MSKNTFDVVIAGAGVIGSAIAYFLSKEKGLSIALVDTRKRGVASWASAGGIWPLGESVGLGCGVIFLHMHIMAKQAGLHESIDKEDFLPHMLQNYLFDFSTLSNKMFPQLSEELKSVSGIDFHLQKTGLMFIIYDDYDEQYASLIEKKIPSKYKPFLKEISKSELVEREPYITKDALGGLLFLGDDQVNPYMLTKAFRDSAQINGVTVFEDTEVIGVDVKNKQVESVTTDSQGKISCGTLINATGAWARDIGNMVGIDLPVNPVKGEIVLSEKLPKVLNSCITTSDCYIAQKNNGELLIGSTTEENITNVDCDFGKINELATGAIRAMPILKELNIKRTWSGLRPGSPDEAPILGPVDGLNGYLNACGHFRTGIVNSPITGVIIRNFITNQNQPIDIKPFLYERFKEL